MQLDNMGFKLYASILTTAIIIIFVISYVLAAFSQVDFFTWVNAAGTMGSILLSGLLIYIYSQMSTIQEGQFKIQRTQADLMRNQQEPWIKVESINILEGTELAEGIFDSFDPDSKNEAAEFYDSTTGFLVEISNRGNGIAYNLELDVEGYVTKAPSHTSFTPFAEYGLEFYTQHLARVGDNKLSLAQPLMGGGGTAIQSGETDEFNAFIGLANRKNISFDTLDSPSASLTNLQSVADRFSQSSTLLIRISIRYEYAGDNSDEEILYRVITPVDEATTLREIDNFGRPMPDYMRNYVDW